MSKLIQLPDGSWGHAEDVQNVRASSGGGHGAMTFTNDQRMAFLSEHPFVKSRWNLVGDARRWLVTTFLATTYGTTFEEALDDMILTYRKCEAEKAKAHQVVRLAGRRWFGAGKAVVR